MAAVGTILAGHGVAYERLIEESRTDLTRSARIWDMEMFCRHRREPDAAKACEHFLALGEKDAIAAAMKWRGDMQRDTMSAATINRRLSTLRRLTLLARTAGVVTWYLDPHLVPDLPMVRVRAQPPLPEREYHAFWRYALRRGDGFVERRERAWLPLMHDYGIGLAAIHSLDLKDVDLTRGLITIRKWGARGTEKVCVSPGNLVYLREWIEIRGAAAGPLFVAYRRKTLHRLATRQFNRILELMAVEAGIGPITPKSIYLSPRVPARV